MPCKSLSSLLVVVEATGTAAHIAFKYIENAKYYHYGRAVAALIDDDNDNDNDNPSGPDQSTDTYDPNSLGETYLALRFNPGPKDLCKGFLFGSDPQTCDVVLAKDKSSGVSSNHFAINVDWDSGNPVITCLTLDGIRIFSESDCAWKLYLRDACKVIESDTTTHLEISDGMDMVIHNPHRNSKDYRYNKNLQDYLKRCKVAVPNMGHMKLYDPEQTPLMISRTRGLTGREYVSTNSTVGDKIVLCEVKGHQDWAADSKVFIVKRFRNASEKWKKHARTTLSLMRGFEERLIISPQDIISDGTEYMPVYLPEPHETLADRLASRGLLRQSIGGLVLLQVFEGLEFLHAHDIIHGGVYPGSIRFNRPSAPYKWKIQLSDVCLSPYVELDDEEERQLYATQRVGSSNPLPVWDTWSAGVVGLLLLSPDGLPTRKRAWTQLKWTTTVMNRAVDFHDKPPAGREEASRFISSVLKVEYDERLPAKICVQDPWLSNTRDVADDESTDTEETTEAEGASDEERETEETTEAKDISDEDVSDEDAF